MKKNVIFLDIDGVLNSAFSKERIGRIKGISDEHIKVLKKIVDFLDADIVLSSSWKCYWNKDLISDGINNWKGSSKKRYGRYLNLRLKPFGLYIVDKTEDYNWSKRPLEISSYLVHHPEIESFVILDDEDFGWWRYQLDSHWVSTVEEDDDYYMWGYVNAGLKDEHFEFIKNNLDNFRR